jgi:hypothetical protein
MKPEACDIESTLHRQQHSHCQFASQNSYNSTSKTASTPTACNKECNDIISHLPIIKRPEQCPWPEILRNAYWLFSTHKWNH